ncbi:MAG: hypothetical protein OEL79_02975 [Chromatiales bacterium]|nr:hypothetical protein [Chromatiales bacterium]
MNRIELDISEGEAPEPLIRATEALQQLPEDSYLHITHRMEPCRLYDYLERNGFYVETRRGESGLCELFIGHDRIDKVKTEIVRLVKDMARWD